jgi:hypothetical protein
MPALQVWRLRTAERSRIARHMHVSAQHLRVTAESLLFGHVTYSPDGTGISFDIGKILSIAVELGTVERAMQTACSLMKVILVPFDILSWLQTTCPGNQQEHAICSGKCMRKIEMHGSCCSAMYLCSLLRLPPQASRQVTCSEASRMQPMCAHAKTRKWEPRH